MHLLSPSSVLSYLVAATLLILGKIQIISGLPQKFFGNSKVVLYQGNTRYEVDSSFCTVGVAFRKPELFSCACVNGIWAFYGDKTCGPPLALIAGNNYCFQLPKIPIREVTSISSPMRALSSSLTIMEPKLDSVKTKIYRNIHMAVDPLSQYITLNSSWTLLNPKGDEGVCLASRDSQYFGNDPTFSDFGVSNELFCSFGNVSDYLLRVGSIERGCTNETFPFMEPIDCLPIMPPNSEDVCRSAEVIEAFTLPKPEDLPDEGLDFFRHTRSSAAGRQLRNIFEKPTTTTTTTTTTTEATTAETTTEEPTESTTEATTTIGYPEGYDEAPAWLQKEIREKMERGLIHVIEKPKIKMTGMGRSMGAKPPASKDSPNADPESSDAEESESGSDSEGNADDTNSSADDTSSASDAESKKVMDEAWNDLDNFLKSANRKKQMNPSSSQSEGVNEDFTSNVKDLAPPTATGYRNTTVISQLLRYLEKIMRAKLRLQTSLDLPNDLSLPKALKLLYIGRDIVKKLCPVILPDFIDLAISVFTEIQLKFFRWTENHLKTLDYKRIQSALVACRETSKPIVTLEKCPQQNSTKKSSLSKKKAALVELPEELKAQGKEPIIESAWKIFTTVHSYCYKFFDQYYNDHHKFTTLMYPLFSNNIQKDWLTNLPADKFFYSSIIGDVNKIWTEIDRCLVTARVSSTYPFHLTRPTLLAEVDKSYTEGDEGSSNVKTSEEKNEVTEDNGDEVKDENGNEAKEETGNEVKDETGSSDQSDPEPDVGQPEAPDDTGSPDQNESEPDPGQTEPKDDNASPDQTAPEPDAGPTEPKDDTASPDQTAPENDAGQSDLVPADASNNKRRKRKVRSVVNEHVYDTEGGIVTNDNSEDSESEENIRRATTAPENIPFGFELSSSSSDEDDPWKNERMVLDGKGFCLKKYNEAKIHLGYGC